MTLEATTTNVNATICSTEAEINMQTEAQDTNVNVTTCFDEDDEQQFNEQQFSSAFNI